MLKCLSNRKVDMAQDLSYIEYVVWEEARSLPICQTLFLHLMAGKEFQTWSYGRGEKQSQFENTCAFFSLA